MALCYAAYLADDLARKREPEPVESLLARAIEYYVGHPYLVADPLVEKAVAAAASRRNEAGAALSEQLRGLYSVSETTRQEEQLVLDRFTASWRSARQARMDWRWGLIPTHFSTANLVSYMFVHGGFLHLLSNMLFLYLAGPFIEDVWGRGLFGLFYLLAGVFSAGMFTVQYPELSVPLVGASGAIAGALGAFFVRHPSAKIRFLLFLGFFRTTFSAPAWLMLPLWFLAELNSATARDTLAPGSGGGGVAYWAHVWGFVFGALVAGGVRGFKLEERFLSEAIEARMVAAVASPVLDRVQRALQANRLDEAWSLLQAELARHPANRDAALAYWELAQRLGRALQAAPVLTRLIGVDLRDGDTESACAHWRAVRAQLPEARLEPELAVQLSERLVKSGRNLEAGEIIRGALQQLNPRTAADVLLRLARVACSADRALAPEAIARALAHPSLPPQTRDELRQLASVSRPLQLDGTGPDLKAWRGGS